MKRVVLIIYLIKIQLFSFAQLGPEVTSWIINTTGATGYNNIESNVQQVQYSTNNVYVSASCIPSYTIGPWASNPNTPVDQNFVYKITRNPIQNAGIATAVGLGHIGVWINGVSIFNVSDGMSYNNQGIWNRNAYYWEGVSFDNCLGHPAPNGEYHHHVSPNCLYDQSDSTHHSPIIGYAFDGFPVYGTYGYANNNGTGGIKRMVSSYVLSAATTRTNGPAVSSSYPAGCFMEDYVYNALAGDLDQRNGRFCVTPDYPNGTYAYFATVNDAYVPTFPYTFYKTYYGVVQSGNTGPNGGHNTISESVTTYDPLSNIVEEINTNNFSVYPNPASTKLTISIEKISSNTKVNLINTLGQCVYSQEAVLANTTYTIDLSQQPAGVYSLQINSGSIITDKKVVVIK